LSSDHTLDIIYSKMKSPHTIYYSSLDEEVCLPIKERFKCTEYYYITLFHELSHVCCSKRRLNIKVPKVIDEVISETVAMILCIISGMNVWGTCESYILMWTYDKKLQKERSYIRTEKQWDKIENSCKSIINYMLYGNK
jgi:antirestriction protein ArdC